MAAVRCALSDGPVVDAVLARCAIPAAFPPVRIGERYLIDGAVASNTPISVAVELGAKRVIVLTTGFACSITAPPRGGLASALHAITLLIAHQLVMELEATATRPRSSPCRRSPRSRCRPTTPYDFSHADELIERAAEQPPALRAHKH